MGWEGVNLSRAFEPVLFDWTDEPLPVEQEVVPSFRLVARGRETTSRVVWPVRESYRPEYRTADASRSASAPPRAMDGKAAGRGSRLAAPHGILRPRILAPPPFGGSWEYVPACAINLLLRPRRPAMDEVVPGFWRIMDAMREPKTLTITLYDRSLQVRRERCG